jgi:DNA-directed RNA polymerase specialized sigma24 family protein
MTNRLGAPETRVQTVVFNETCSIEKDALDRAIAGAIKRAGLGPSPAHVREDIFSDVYCRLVEFFNKGNTLTGKVSSLAYQIAYRVAIDTYRRPGQYEQRKKWGADVAEVTPGADVEPAMEHAEARLLRQADALMKAGLLTKAIGTISPEDRNALVEMLERKTPLKRSTPEERKLANAMAQREKRARDRLTKVIRADSQER